MKNILVDGVWTPIEDCTQEQILEYLGGLTNAQVLIRQEF